jgi:hypothetical protein
MWQGKSTFISWAGMKEREEKEELGFHYSLQGYTLNDQKTSC